MSPDGTEVKEEYGVQSVDENLRRKVKVLKIHDDFW
jgi:hypothetical protein